ncbi:YdcF family protein [Marinobacter sp. MDS2]|uniref:YdcF family protein n=1 Tax=Marinobacter sp. MDS2 TaxID=3065961 RepID=UPI00273AD0A3|nr:YdcF family protein [Marinobacter sp. MDS2]MDP4546867.1 YdcF family protein [Marinobacter sp. MDS2]
MFIISKLAIALISPLGASIFGGLLGVVLALWGRLRLAISLGVLALLWLWFWSLPAASNWVRGYLENQHPPMAIQDVPQAEAIVVLGGGVSPAGHGDLYPNLESGADRVWHAARLFHASKAPLVLLIGGSDPSHSAASEAEAMGQFMRDLGVPGQALVLENRSRNTSQNAEYSAEILAGHGISRILLVTSAYHMPRARRLFEAQGLEVVPVATDHEVLSRPLWRNLLPDTRALDGSSRAIKEIVGRLAGR